MENQTYQMAMLFDFYSEVLTPRQREFFDLYHNEDLSLGEIAQNSGITRQGVRDVIVRAEHVLTNLEKKTGIIDRFHTLQKHISQLEQLSIQLESLANVREDEPLLAISQAIATAIAQLQEQEDVREKEAE